METLVIVIFYLFYTNEASGTWDSEEKEEAMDTEDPEDAEDDTPPIRHKHVSESDKQQEHINVVFIGHVGE